MVNFQPGDPVIYLKARKEPGEDGWWDRFPATYVCRQKWGRSERLKILIHTDGIPLGRYVHPLSVISTPQHRAAQEER